MFDSKTISKQKIAEINPTYDISKSYDYNFSKGPFYNQPLPSIIPTGEKYNLLGYKLNSPLGVAAGLLLNSSWVKLYAELGFDILTYKTVRSVQHTSHPNPNCLLLNYCGQLNDNFPLTAKEFGQQVPIDKLSITNSFGVPSASPDYWRRDVELAKSYLKKGQILIVSVVGTTKEFKCACTDDNVETFIRDFQQCAKWAKEAGADIIELDFSCPNSPVEEGEIYKDPVLSSAISQTVKKEIGDTPLFIKIGYIEDYEKLSSIVKANAPFINGVAGINTLKRKVILPDGQQALPGHGRETSGICGAMIRECGLKSSRNLVKIRKEGNYEFAIIGIGGAMIPEHIEEYLNIGVDAVQVATAAMYDPHLAYKYNQFALEKIEAECLNSIKVASLG
jgi:dihydroorotate dehydrogenase (NAD+) catalytic subunit